jgi:amino acid permease
MPDHGETGAVPPATRRVAVLGLAAVALLFLVSGLAEAAGATGGLETPLVLLLVVAVLSLLSSWLQAILLVTRDRLLLKRQRSDWIVALVLLGPFAGCVFILWYARRTAS